MIVQKPTRIHALEIGLAWEKKNVHEVGRPNGGPIVEMIQRADALSGEFYAWCQSTQNFFWRLATGGKIKVVGGREDLVGGEMLCGGTASVGFAVAHAREKGWIVSRPLRGDHFAMQLNNDNWPDHTGQIVRVLKLGGFGFLCQTLEGNTSGDSIDEGDSLEVKTRFLSSSRTIFYRAPGTVRVVVPDSPAVVRRKLRATILSWKKQGWSWARIKATPQWARFRNLGGK